MWVSSSKFFLHHLGSHRWYSNIEQSYRVFFSISHWGSTISAAGTSGSADHLACTLNCFNVSTSQVHCFLFLRCDKTSLVVSFCFAGCRDSVLDGSPSPAPLPFCSLVRPQGHPQLSTGSLVVHALLSQIVVCRWYTKIIPINYHFPGRGLIMVKSQLFWSDLPLNWYGVHWKYFLLEVLHWFNGKLKGWWVPRALLRSGSRNTKCVCSAPEFFFSPAMPVELSPL